MKNTLNNSMFKRLQNWLANKLKTDKPVVSRADISDASAHSDHEKAQHVVPYDENLLERSRTQWQFGDWASLAALERDTLQHHPDRAKLALLAAAGHAQQGQTEQARQFTRLAQDWGCSKKLISQILISGVHNSLGRAAATAGQQTRTQHHFESAIAIGNPGSDRHLLAKVRLNEQHTQMGVNVNYANIKDGASESRSAGLIGSIPTIVAIEELGKTIKQQKVELDKQLKKQNDDLISVRKFLDSSLKNEVANATKQIEAAVGLQSYFATGELPNINTERHSWPVSPDFSLYLVELLEANNYDLIIEFGSGISTVIIAKTLAKMAERRKNKQPVNLVSFDHLEKYYNQTLAQLRQAGLADKVQLELAPLEPYTAPNGTTYAYYSCHESLATLAKKYGQTEVRVLVVIDGPPAATGKHARYPAAPSVLKYFRGANLSFLLDDYIRDDEKEIAALWQSEFSALGLAQITTIRSLEKDACLITVTAAVMQAEVSV